MANPAVISFVNYGWETTFGTVSTQLNKTFGQGTRLSSLTRRNNVESVFGLGSRNATKLVPKNFEGIATVEFALSNPWFFRAVMGTVSSTGTAPATHTFAEANTIPSISIENNITTDTVAKAHLLGAKVNSCTINAAVNEIARVRLDVVYSDEAFSTSAGTYVAPSFEVFTFAHGTFELPNGTTIAEVQSAEVVITNNAQMVYGAGDRRGQQCVVKNREYSARVSVAFEDATKALHLLYGASTGPTTNTVPAESSDLELTFTNSLTQANKRAITMTFTGAHIDEHNLPQDPTALIIEDLAIKMRSLSVKAENGTQTAP